MSTATARPDRLGPLLTWRYLVEYARRPLNLVLLAVVPVVFVTLSAGAIADFADLLRPNGHDWHAPRSPAPAPPITYTLSLSRS